MHYTVKGIVLPANRVQVPQGDCKFTRMLGKIMIKKKGQFSNLKAKK